MGRRLKLAPTTTDIMKLSPWEYLEATLRNRGKAQFDKVGNVVVEGGKPWIGGNPFPDAKTGVEIFASITLSWGRHDAAFYALKEYDLGVEGDVRRSEEHTSELQSLMRISYAVFCLKQKRHAHTKLRN